MILIGLGSNLTAPGCSGRRATLRRAVDLLTAGGVAVEALSPWYESEPVPPSDQPWYVNAVAAVTTVLDPDGLLTLLHRIEARLGRRRSAPNAARTVDLDLLDYRGLIHAAPGDGGLVVPHPRLHERRFVLLPLRDVAPDWRHPRSGLDVEAMLRRIGNDGGIVRRIR